MAPLLVAPRTSPATSLSLPSLRAPPPVVATTDRLLSARSRLHRPPQLKVRKGEEPPRLPLRFSPFPDRRRASGHRQSPPPVGTAARSTPLLCYVREEGDHHLAKNPLHFSFVTPSPSLLYSISLFLLSSKPYPINQFTNQPLLFQSQLQIGP
jgi:hypothetical protein